MPISAATVFEVRTTGATTNGGGYDSTLAGANGDLSQSDTGIAITFTSAGAGNDVTITSGNEASLKIGNTACITGGTNVNQGFYQLTNLVGTTATFSTRKDGTSIASGAAVGGTGNLGGAFKLGATTANRADDDFFECLTNATGGGKYWVQYNASAHVAGGAITIATTGLIINPILVEGYYTSRGDLPTIASGNQPTINMGANPITYGTAWITTNITYTGTGTSVVIVGANGRAAYCKATNSSGTAGRNAFAANGANCTFFACEGVSTNGNAISTGNQNNIFAYYCYLHDSDKGFLVNTASTGGHAVIGCIIDTIVTSGIDFNAGAYTGSSRLIGNTLYGAASPTGSSSGIKIAASSGDFIVLNNILSGWVTGVNAAGSIPNSLSNFNNFYNNTTNRTNWSTGASDIALDPAFVDAPNGDFSVGTNMKAAGYPGAFPGGLSTGYMDIGAVQRQEASGGGGSHCSSTYNWSN